MRDIRALLGLLALLALALPARADSGDEEIAKLRDLLRQNTVALREAQDQNAALTAKAAQLQTELDAARKAAEDASAKAKPSADAEAELHDTQAALKTYQDKMEEAQTVLAKWQSSYQEAATVARARDAAARDFEGKYKESDALFQDCSTKNAALEKLARELLDKFNDRGFLEAMEGSEPFTQIHRVELENIVQDYDDKLRDAKVSQVGK